MRNLFGGLTLTGGDSVTKRIEGSGVLRGRGHLEVGYRSTGLSRAIHADDANIRLVLLVFSSREVG